MTRAEIRYSAMTVDHYDPVITLWRTTPGIGLAGAGTREAFNRYLDRNPGLSFVAAQGDAVVGAVASGHDAHRGYLYHLAVKPECRGLGIGAELTRCCIDALSRLGLERTHIFVNADNESGLEFWRHAGWYRRDDVVMYTWTHDGTNPVRSRPDTGEATP